MNVHFRQLGGRIACLGGILFLAVQAVIFAQEPSLEELPGLRERAVVMRIVSRIVEQNQQVVWYSENSKVTIPGRPVGLKLVSSNLVVAVQFTPFLRPEGRHMLVAQGQIWINIPNEGISYRTTIQTIPLNFSEQIYFFPLGSDATETQDEARIEIQLMLEPYTGRTPSAETVNDSENTGAKSENTNSDSGKADAAAHGENLTPQ